MLVEAEAGFPNLYVKDGQPPTLDNADAVQVVDYQAVNKILCPLTSTSAKTYFVAVMGGHEYHARVGSPTSFRIRFQASRMPSSHDGRVIVIGGSQHCWLCMVVLRCGNG